MICGHHFLQNTYLVLQNVDHIANVVNGVIVNDNWQSEVWQWTWNECQWWFAWVDGGQKLVGPSDDMEKV